MEINFITNEQQKQASYNLSILCYNSTKLLGSSLLKENLTDSVSVAISALLQWTAE